MTFGARLRAAMDRARPAVRRHRPARLAAAGVGAVRRRWPGWNGSPRPSSRRWPTGCRCSSRSRRSTSGSAARGVAVLEQAIAARRAAGALVAARRQARRHRLHVAGVRRRVPRPVARPWPSTRSRPAPTSASARSSPIIDDGAGQRRRRVRAGPDLQPGGSRRSSTPPRLPGGRSPAACWPAGRAQRRRDPARLARALSSGRRSVTPARTSASTARCWCPASALRAAPPTTYGGCSDHGARNVLPSSSREILRAGPSVDRLREAASRAQESIASLSRPTGHNRRAAQATAAWSRSPRRGSDAGRVVAVKHP